MRKEENFSKEYFKTVVRCIENLYFDGCNIYIKYYTLDAVCSRRFLPFIYSDLQSLFEH